jgi:hypothetical protein
MCNDGERGGISSFETRSRILYGSYELDNESLGSIKYSNIIEYMTNYGLLKKESAT